MLSGEIPSFSELALFSPSYYKMMKLNLSVDTTAKSIDPHDKEVKFKQLKAGKKQ